MKTVACFKSENEIENLHRNNQKKPLLKSPANQELRRVVSKRAVWWYPSKALLKVRSQR